MLRPRLLSPRLAVATAATAAITFAACSDSTTEPASIAGTYNATTLRVTEQGQPDLDLLAAGMRLSLTIAPSNATTGTLFTPAIFTTNSADTTQSLSGTAVRTGNSVRFTQAADTFVRDLTFTISGNTLQAKQAFDNQNITVVLTR